MTHYGGSVGPNAAFTHSGKSHEQRQSVAGSEAFKSFLKLFIKHAELQRDQFLVILYLQRPEILNVDENIKL